jgi:adenylate kinase family enzyme
MTNFSSEQEENNSNKPIDKSLIGYVVHELGGVLFAVESIDKVLGFAGKAFRDNKFYQGSIKALRGMNPVLLTGHKVYSAVKGFREQQKQLYARQKKSVTILRLMKLEHLDEYELDCTEYNIGREIINWLISRPKTESFKIIEFYNSDFEPASSKNFEKGELFILIESDSSKFMIEANIVMLNQQIFVSNCQVHSIASVMKGMELRTKIFSEFIKYFDTSKNVIEMNTKGLSTRPRIGFDYNVFQFDVDSFKNELINAINKGKKRGYILVGPPGVGKSTVIIKLEKELPNIPVVYITSSINVFREDVANTFNFLRSISPCIAIFEDLDGYELAHKQDRIFGEFIEQMDSLKHQECIIIIATLNEPDAVHASLINRRGRFDKVFFVDYPKTNEEIISVMRNKLKKENGQELPFDSIRDDMLKKICDNNFSHSDVCEVVESLIINDIPITMENIDKGIEEVVKTMKAIHKCSNGNETFEIKRVFNDEE